LDRARPESPVGNLLENFMIESYLSGVIAEFYHLGIADLGTIATLAILEGILSVDNSLVLAILVRPLPPKQRRKALTYGIAGAFVFRLIALIFAARLMQFVAFKAIGGGYLIYLSMKHMFFFSKEEAHRTSPKTAGSFWKTIFVVEMTDIAFSIDSITTAVAMTRKLSVVWIGGIMGIIFLRFAAGFFVRLLEKMPRLEDLAYQLIFFIGTKLFLESFHVEIQPAVFWYMMAVIVILGAGIVYRDMRHIKARTRRDRLLHERLESGNFVPEDLFEMESIPQALFRELERRGRISIQPVSEPAPSPPKDQEGTR